MDTVEAIRRHAPHVALQFSGGRDSLAMLLALRAVWDSVTVYYCNSGDAYPETLALVDRVRAMVPSFVEVAGNSPATTSAFGYPSDVLPPGASYILGHEMITGHVPLIDRIACCFLSVMRPLHERMVADGVTCLVRGQRASDDPKSPVEHGEVSGGFLALFPIRHWTDLDVENEIRSSGWEMPPFYQHGAVSAPNCMRCTAWLEHNPMPYLRAAHPDVAAEVDQRLATIRRRVAPYSELLEQA